jgi:predicted transcriptional regulator
VCGVVVIKVLLIALIFISMGSSLQGINVGDNLPLFNLESGDCYNLSSGELSGKVTFFFYDNKNTFQRNNDFKLDLYLEYLALTDSEKEDIEIMQVIDCSEANLLSKFFWKKALIRNSRRYNMRIWGDWDGGLKQNCMFMNEESYMLIIDQAGKVVYFQDKLFSAARIREITELVKGIIYIEKVR